MREQACEARRRKHKTKLVLQRILNAALVRCFEQLRNYAEEERLLRAKLYKVVARLKNQCVATAMQLWQDAVAGDLVIKEENKRKEQEREAKTRKVLQRLMNRTLVEAVELFRVNAAEEQDLRRKAKKVMQRVMNAGLVRAFELLRANAEEEKGLRAKLYKVVARLKNQCVATAMQLWQDAVRGDLTIREENKRMEQEFEAKTCKVT
jgi:hypothetical protein